MSVTIATRLRSLAHELDIIVAQRANDSADPQRLRQMAAELVEIAQQLERDARD
jgi:septum formation topological specificity factor MinE